MRPPNGAERCFELVAAGAPLRDAADALGLGWWLRRLPPRAFSAPLPEFPLDQEFALRIANLIPRDERAVPTWLARVGHAFEAGGGADYALWIARQADLAAPPDDLFLFMAAWAWFSGQPGLPGHRLLRRPWTPEMSFKRAREELGGMAPAAAADRVPGPRHREDVARRRAGIGLRLRGAAHGRRLHRRERGAGELPRPVCRPAARRAHRRLLDPQGRAARGLRGDRPARRGGDHADHRAAARRAQPARAAGGLAGDLQPGSAANGSSRCRRCAMRPSR